MKSIINIFLTLCFIFGIYGCTGMDDICKEYVIDGGRKYPQKPVDPKGLSGDEKVIIEWTKGVDNSIVKAIVTWDDGHSSKEFVIDPADEEIKLVLDNLDERDYSFIVRTCDAEGNMSVPVEVNARSYGSNYKASLYNRTIGLAYINDLNKLIVEWNDADITSGIVRTDFTYTNTNDELITKEISYDDNTTFVIDDYKANTTVGHQSFFVPDANCVDEFTSVNEEEMPLNIIDRSNWTAKASSFEDNAQLPAGGPPEFVLDGNKYTFWHTAHDPIIVWPPHWISIDMKRPILMKRLMIQGRNDGAGQDIMFNHFKLEVRNSDTEAWMPLEEFDVTNRADRNMLYYPILTKQYYSQFRIYIAQTIDFFCALSEVAVLGLEEEQ